MKREEQKIHGADLETVLDIIMQEITKLKEIEDKVEKTEKILEQRKRSKHNIITKINKLFDDLLFKGY